ncbi:hypothetical protein A3A93_00505 [Candidatus Roizmanbacteria bacterium RIFCSPLOWO2_01_FULL_38_12]|uniref:Glycosyl transferase family 1 domain-containing protein n=1 Tax=Candidatus Roizmanbacteria bacterium RIFCSPLOWO2_01_FULL_38_12 TaxID=1802061 RepID=A0A1F7IXQ5_9BACT|nr:MAG: hypothetical protein A2861_00185 [Candidatus Roizmanbacteria bacterium RIFCSPHIGHO2_01_FULL_38_15]OGK36113.1 MAG: hypothetical protein A3F59_01430 [Candidatus Roizmanbacteria bacterium RIFCSPHIGHO2_12_FULL_38_13]OGK48159.1 MAG: hypothetical protein A3A93_00505 [Candidatus Roizmanbacteria bacterium RIFCSPLOWO2_01_FULL_38_12]
MKRKIAGLYDPYLDILGGGERLILSIMKVLCENGFALEIFWDSDMRQQIKNSLNISFASEVKFTRNIFKHRSSPIEKARILSRYDKFFYVTDGSYFYSTAKKTYIYCMVPEQSLYRQSLINRMKTWNNIYIAISKYTQGWIKKWGIDSKLIYPYIENDFMQYDQSFTKKPIILSVGRFFRHLHAKRHDVAIQWFSELQEKHSEFKKYKLIIAGRVLSVDRDYFNELKNLASGNNSILFYPNCSYERLLSLYRDTSYYWHMTGIDADTQKHPEKAEHLGITPLEAMAAGGIVCGYSAGGIPELVTHGQNGYLFTTKDELMRTMINCEKNIKKQNIIRSSAHDFIKSNFSYEVFTKRVAEVILTK